MGGCVSAINADEVGVAGCCLSSRPTGEVALFLAFIGRCSAANFRLTCKASLHGFWKLPPDNQPMIEV